MASSGGTSSASSSMEEGGLAALMEQRKRKRMISNRESARRSRMRKQKHLDDLMAMVTQLRKDNQQIGSNLAVTTQHYAVVEAENSILRAQAAELSHRLKSLNEIVAFLNPSDGTFEDDTYDYDGAGAGAAGLFNPLQMAFYMSQPLMASADVFDEY